MSGKILKVSSNDLYGNVDNRSVCVYACFEHTKYMNNYVVFSIEGSNKLCYGSVHIKEKSLVIFAVKKEIEKYMIDFLGKYMNDKLDEFKILNISKVNKVELVSYSEMEYDKINLLRDKSIPKNIVSDKENIKTKKPIFLYLLVFVLCMFAIGITVLYLKPEWFSVKYKELVCSNKIYDNNINLYYNIEKNFKFDENDKVDSINVVRNYIFLDSNLYYQFKNEEKHYEYFNDGEGYKYVDKELLFKVIYQEKTIIDDYDEMLTYMKKEGYSCIERQYEK